MGRQLTHCKLSFVVGALFAALLGNLAWAQVHTGADNPDTHASLSARIASDNHHSANHRSSVHEGRQLAARLPHGLLVTAVGWAVDAETSLDVLRGKVEYYPAEDGNSCSSIRFIQVAKVASNRGGDYQWQGMEEPRNFLRTSANEHDGIKGGYFVDHKAWACRNGMSCSPYFRDSWRNDSESEDGFQVDSASAAASLVDYPFGWTQMAQISLESCARCVDTGQFLGCAEWGARWPIGGQRNIDPIHVRANPSRTFLSALHRFEKFYARPQVSQNQGH